jgi:F0F1-type ATP synthase assembly protein I
MIRLEVEQYPPPSAAPVGGLIYGADRVAVVSPWLAVIGTVGCVATVAIVVRKRRP